MNESWNINPEAYRRFADAISRFVVGYHKSLVQARVTQSSFSIVGSNIATIKNQLAQVVAAFEEIRATSQSTSTNAESINGLMVEVVRANTAMSDGMDQRVGEIGQATGGANELASLFLKLSEKSRTIADATGRIQDVSDRTNVLAINASIEAARAGTVGRGFRIIAGEVKNLASQTGAFAQEISGAIDEFSGVVKSIESRMSGFIALMGRLSNDLKAMSSVSSETNERAVRTGQSIAEITGSIREESEALNDGLKSLEMTFTFLQDSLAVLEALVRSHDALDQLLSGAV
ncbi:MAG: hypothetical protein HC888_06245 [Candidatus Competibacteraceae bacterium]|nr:hypothetical protein [Candidatus Competibacteraceae bacterium]